MKIPCTLILSLICWTASTSEKKALRVEANMSIEKIEREYEVKYVGSMDAQMFYGIVPMWIFVKSDPELAMMKGFMFSVRQQPSDKNVCEAIVSGQLEAKTIEAYIKQHKDDTKLNGI